MKKLIDFVKRNKVVIAVVACGVGVVVVNKLMIDKNNTMMLSHGHYDLMPKTEEVFTEIVSTPTESLEA